MSEGEGELTTGGSGRGGGEWIRLRCVASLDSYLLEARFGHVGAAHLGRLRAETVRLHEVLAHPLAVRVHGAQIARPARQAVLVRLLEELEGARVVDGPDAPALLVEQAEGQLGLPVALVGA